MDLGNAVCGAAQAGDLPSSVLPSLSLDLEALYFQAYKEMEDMTPEELEAARVAAEARREQAEANAP